MPISAVVFDIDGTLYPWRKLWVQLVGTFLLRLRFFRKFYGVRRELRRRGKVDDLRSLQATLLAHALEISEEQARQKIDWFVGYRLNKACARIAPFPSLHEFLLLLSELKIKVAVLSDFPIGQRLSSMGLSVPSGFAICSEDFNALKPEPDSFLYISKKLSCLPHEVLYIGDNYHYDIIGAYKVGMQTAHLCRHSPQDSVATVSFSTYSELGEWLRERYTSPISKEKL